MRAGGVAFLSVVLILAGAHAQSPDNNTQDIPLPNGLRGILAHSAILFSFVPRGMEDSAWEIEVRQDLTGSFRKKAESIDKATPITVSKATLQKLENGDGAAFESHACETRQKKIAQTGKKKLTYVQGVALSSCDFNYSDDEKVNQTASTFIAIAETMQTGDKLAKLHRFDRLGLDAAMDIFVSEVKEGRALEVQNIASVLQSIATDDRVIERVRRSAARLLQDAGVAVDASR